MKFLAKLMLFFPFLTPISASVINQKQKDSLVSLQGQIQLCLDLDCQDQIWSDFSEQLYSEIIESGLVFEFMKKGDFNNHFNSSVIEDRIAFLKKLKFDVGNILGKAQVESDAEDHEFQQVLNMDQVCCGTEEFLFFGDQVLSYPTYE